MSDIRSVFSEVRDLTKAIHAKRGTRVGIVVEQGKFSVVEDTKDGKHVTSTYLTGWQSHAECVSFMRGIAAQ